MVVRVVTDLTRVRLARLPSRVEVKERDGLWDGTVRVGPVLEPGPVLVKGVKIKGGSDFSGGVRGADACDAPAQVDARLLKLEAAVLELVEQRPRVLVSRGNRDLQVSDASGSCEVPDDIHSIAVLKADEGSVEDLAREVREGRDGGQHPVHAGLHALELHRHFPTVG